MSDPGKSLRMLRIRKLKEALVASILVIGQQFFLLTNKSPALVKYTLPEFVKTHNVHKLTRKGMDPAEAQLLMLQSGFV